MSNNYYYCKSYYVIPKKHTLVLAKEFQIEMRGRRITVTRINSNSRNL